MDTVELRPDIWINFTIFKTISQDKKVCKRSSFYSWLSWIIIRERNDSLLKWTFIKSYLNPIFSVNINIIGPRLTRKKSRKESKEHLRLISLPGKENVSKCDTKRSRLMGLHSHSDKYKILVGAERLPQAGWARRRAILFYCKLVGRRPRLSFTYTRLLNNGYCPVTC